MTSTPPCIVTGGTDRGLRRARNEDSFAILPERGIAVVADGMGGHPGGDVASEIAARTAAERLLRAFPPTNNSTRETREGAMRQAALDAHEAVLSRSRAEPSLTGMGTTTTACVVDPVGARYTIGNVGDSRAYLLRRARLQQLTRDDTWLEDQIDAGAIRREDAAGHPDAHLLTQCVGLTPAPEPRVLEGAVHPGDVLLLCSDGLTAGLSDGEIRSVLTGSLEGTVTGAEHAVARLIEASNAAGGVDNVTVVLVVVPESDV